MGSKPDKVAAVVVRRLEQADAAGQWRTGTAPTRTIVVDQVLPEAVARDAHRHLANAPPPLRQRASFRERKRVCHHRPSLESVLGELIAAFEHPLMVAGVARATGIADLESDPSLYAAGLSAMRRGDFLNPHLDNSHDRARRRYRRVNLLYYLTPDWRDEWGGALELWNPAVERAVAIPARFNRLVLMETNSQSWHSASPITDHAGDERLCLSSYFFSAAPPLGSSEFRITSFTGRPRQPLRRAISGANNALRQCVRERIAQVGPS